MKATQPSGANLEAVEWLLKPLGLEVRNGYADAAVSGGLGQWLPRVREKLQAQAGLGPEQADRLLTPLADYAAATPGERAAKVKQVRHELDALKSPKPTAPSAKPGTAPRPAASGDSGPVQWDEPVQYFKGVGPNRARLLARIGVRTVGDLLRYYPRDWQDRRHILPLHQAKAGEVMTLQGTVRLRTTFRIRRGLTLTKIVLDDGTGQLAATWFNQPYMRDRFEDGQRVMVHGKVEFFRGWQMSNPDYELLGDESEDTIHTGRIVPVYALTEGLSQRVLRTLMVAVLARLPQQVPETLPPGVRGPEGPFPSARQAVTDIHFPPDQEALNAARERLVFEELFLQQLAVVRLRSRYQLASGKPLETAGPRFTRFLENLPFTLTSAQEQALNRITADLRQPRPMHRLLQGDVGSGKTVVAVLAMLCALDSDAQAAIMAPTEVLAGQHYLTLKRLLDPLGVRLELFVSGQPAAVRKEARAALRDGAVQIAVGTHALTQETVEFRRLGLAVIDEQHRFGVEQRALLRAKGDQPHVLVMTATPIPRTLAMTVYGELDVASIGELPPGRIPVRTLWLRRSAARRAYEHIAGEVERGRQAYVIFPLIEDSEKLDLKSLTTEYTRLSRDLFPDRRIGLLHGRLSAAEKETVMAEFKAGRLDILAATSVVEVGVDVPNASVICIEDADRFGLAQLHQLRGRVGRSSIPSTCFLVADPRTEEGKRRMEIMTKVGNGFQLAEEDLALRGPGEFFGVRQHGLPDLKLAHLIRDANVIEPARQAAESVLQADPELEKAEHHDLKMVYEQLFSDKENHALTG